MASYAETLDSNAKMRKRPKPELRSIELSKAENGGVIAEHRMTEYTGKEPKHVFGADEGHKLREHIEKHLGIKISETHGKESQEPEKEAEEQE
jgi:hypothetical protein